MKRATMGLMVFALAGCHKSAPPAPKAAPVHTATPAAKPAPVAAAAPKAAPAPVVPQVNPTSAQAVLARMHAIDADEIALAAQAKSNAHGKAAKSLAALVSKTQSKDDGAVTALAKKLDANLVDPASLNMPAADKQDAAAIHQELAAAKSKTGAQFDQAFAAAIYDADKRESAMLTADAVKSSTPELVKLAKLEDSALESQEKLAQRDMHSGSKKGHRR